MLATMRREVFASIDDVELGLLCFEPIIKDYKAKIQLINGSENNFKSQFYKQLTNGQRALFMFYVYFNHTKKSINEFFWWSAYYFAQPKVWGEIKDGLRYLNTDAMLKILEEMERVLRVKNYPLSLEKFDVTFNELNNDQGLFTTIAPLNARFHEISSDTLKKIGVHIRNNRNNFIQFEN